MFKASEGKEKILHRIRGSRVVIPDLFALFPGWKFNVNRHYDSVKIKTDKWLERCVTTILSCYPQRFIFIYIVGSKATPFGAK
jgi:hypothetical protein